MARLASPNYRPPEVWQPIPAAFTSYSSWAGRTPHVADVPTAAFRGESKRVHTENGGDPGAYHAHERSDTIAATAAFTHNKRLTGTSPEREIQEVKPAPLPVPVELFPLNRHPLRGEPPPTMTGAAPQAWMDGARAAGDAAAASTSTAASPASIAGGSALTCASQSLSVLGLSVTTRDVKQEREAREAEERQAKWAARHARSAPPPKPTPSPGAGKRAAARLHGATTTAKDSRDAYASLAPLAPLAPPLASSRESVDVIPESFRGRADVLPSRAGSTTRRPRSPGPRSPGPPGRARGGGDERTAASTGSSSSRSTHRTGTGTAAGGPRAQSPQSTWPASGGKAGGKSGVVRRHPQTRNYYQILDVATGAADAEVRQAYHALAKKWHPDRNHDERAERMFKLVNRAYQVLGDVHTRRQYDRGVNVDSKFAWQE